MSVENLKIKTNQGDIIEVVSKVDGEFEFEIFDGDSLRWFWLDLNQADLLRLWLEEHLK